MSTFYPQNDYRGYLSHHGIKGQKWGEQNGPPYPLSTKMHNMVVKGRQKRAEKRRQKILHDPKKLTKHATEFSKEEIDAAVAKIDSINKAKDRIPKKPMSEKKKAKLNKKAEKALAKKIRKYASTPRKLTENVDKFTTDELQKAIDRLSKKDAIFEKRMNQADRPRKVIELGSNYLGTALSLAKNISGLKKQLTPYNPKKLTNDQRHTKWLIDNGFEMLLKPDQIDSLSKDWKFKQDKAKAEDNMKSKQMSSEIKELKETINNLEKDNEALKIAQASVTPMSQITISPEVIEWYLSNEKPANDMDDWEKLIHSDVFDTKMNTFYDDQNDLENYLEHYGVKGMRWGHRKADVYDDLYYRAKYNNKKVKTYADLKRKKISRGKYAVKRLGQIAGRGILDPYKLGFRSVGRDIRGGYRLVTGKTFRKTNDHEYSANRNALFNEIKDKKTMAKINYLVNQTINDNSIDNEGNPIVNMDALYDVLDRAQLKEIEKIKFNK